MPDSGTPGRTYPHLLILGGTAEAAELSQRIAACEAGPVRVTVSLAGRTSVPSAQNAHIRIGGFGGAEGLAAYLQREAIDMVIDATHPFADRISANASAACRRAEVPLLRLDRLAWQKQPGDHWIDVADATEAAALLPNLGRRVWLTSGASTLAAFAPVDACDFLIRLIEPPPRPLTFRQATLLFARGPFDLATERRMIAVHRIQVLVTKASGGAATAPKLIAAREAGIPVVMLRRPAAAGETRHRVETVGAALDWLFGQISKSGVSDP